MGIYAAVTRRTLDGAQPEGWVPEQKISVAQAVRAYTAGSAYAEGQDAVKGTLEPRKLADLVVLSDDIFAINPAAIEHVRVAATPPGGEAASTRHAVPAPPLPEPPSPRHNTPRRPSRPCRPRPPSEAPP